MWVPLEGRDRVKITHESVDTTKETLGAWTCPSGAADSSLMTIKKEAQNWVDRALTGISGFCTIDRCGPALAMESTAIWHPGLNWRTVYNINTGSLSPWAV